MSEPLWFFGAMSRLLVIFFLFNFMRMGVLSPCISVLRRPEEGIGSPGTGWRYR